jgi:hypothetical protein
VRDNAPELRLMHDWLDSWYGLGLIVAEMTHQGWDVQLTAYAWCATFFPVGIAHSFVGGTASGADAVACQARLPRRGRHPPLTCTRDRRD